MFVLRLVAFQERVPDDLRERYSMGELSYQIDRAVHEESEIVSNRRSKLPSCLRKLQLQLWRCENELDNTESAAFANETGQTARLHSAQLQHYRTHEGNALITYSQYNTCL